MMYTVKLNGYSMSVYMYFKEKLHFYVFSWTEIINTMWINSSLHMKMYYVGEISTEVGILSS